MQTLSHAFDSPVAVSVAAGHANVRVTGDLDLPAIDELVRALDALADQQVDRIDVDLTHAARLDSTGVEALADAHGRLARRGGRVAVVGASDPVEALLRRRGLSGLLRAS